MAEKILIVVDMQKDFVNGSLGSKDAEAIVPAVVKKAKEFDGDLIFTKDTHFENYMDTQEGHFLPVPHCIKGTDGWDLIPELEKIAIERDAATYEKITFGCPELAEDLLERNKKTPIESIELGTLYGYLCGFKRTPHQSVPPETPVFVDSACAAGVTRENMRRFRDYEKLPDRCEVRRAKNLSAKPIWNGSFM